MLSVGYTGLQKFVIHNENDFMLTYKITSRVQSPSLN